MVLYITNRRSMWNKAKVLPDQMCMSSFDSKAYAWRIEGVLFY